MIGLTQKQRDCLYAIEAHLVRVGSMPTLAELAATLGLKSRSGAASMLQKLELRGALARIPNKTRAIVLLRQACPHCGKSLWARPDGRVK